jgi:exonuclease III
MNRSVNCITWNVGLRSDNKEGGETRFQTKKAFLNAELGRGDYDVICLQEIELKRGKKATGITHIDASLLTTYDYVIHEPRDLSLPHGNLILWRRAAFKLVGVPVRCIPLAKESVEEPTRYLKALHIVLEDLSTGGDIHRCESTP